MALEDLGRGAIWGVVPEVAQVPVHGQPNGILDEEEDTCEKLSFGVFHSFHFFAHPQISRV